MVFGWGFIGSVFFGGVFMSRLYIPTASMYYHILPLKKQPVYIYLHLPYFTINKTNRNIPVPWIFLMGYAAFFRPHGSVELGEDRRTCNGELVPCFQMGGLDQPNAATQRRENRGIEKKPVGVFFFDNR